MEQVTVFLFVFTTMLCGFYYLHLHRNRVVAFLIQPRVADVIGARFDKHSVVHFYFGAVFAWVFGIWFALAVNFIWECFDVAKPTVPLGLSEKPTVRERVLVCFYNEFCVSEGRFDVLDFAIMAGASLLAVMAKAAVNLIAI